MTTAGLRCCNLNLHNQPYELSLYTPTNVHTAQTQEFHQKQLFCINGN